MALTYMRLPRLATAFAAPSSLARTPLASTLGAVRAASTTASFDSTDNNYVADRTDLTGDDKRAFTYMMLGGARFIYSSTVRLALIKGIATLSASADVLALASLEVDLGGISEGECVTVKWRGKPVFIKHRTDDQISEVADTDISQLRDPEKDSDRCTDPKWLIVLGVCTHLGCVPIPNAGEYNGWFCPCHGSHYDGAGRIRKGPAPLNLEVPPYKFTDDDKVVLG